MSQPRRARWRVAIVLVSALATLGIGVVIGGLLLPAAVPASLAAGRGPAEVPVTKMDTDDRQSVSLALSTVEPQELVARRSGIVTSTTCVPGVEAVSGTSSFSVDDAPLIYLATPRPLWRDLASGDRGPDVEALQTELSRLGHDVAVDGHFGRATLEAAIAMARKSGDESARRWTAFPAASVIWLPAASVHANTCDAAVGAGVTSGTVLATLPPALVSAAVKPLPTRVMVGDRVVVVEDLTLPVDAGGTITNAADLRALSRSSAYRAFLEGRSGRAAGTGAPAVQEPGTSGASGPTMSVDYRLATPLEVYSVPAAAVYNVNETEACVLSKGSSLAVTIADSQLGQTLVVPVSAQMALRSVSLEHRRAAACR